MECLLWLFLTFSDLVNDLSDVWKRNKCKVSVKERISFYGYDICLILESKFIKTYVFIKLNM